MKKKFLVHPGILFFFLRGKRSNSLIPILILFLPFLFLPIFFNPTMVVAQGGSFADEVSSGRQLVENFEALVNNPQANKRSLLKIAMEISNNTEARMLLKSPQYQALGSRYYGLWFDGKDGLVENMIERMKAKLSKEGYPEDVLEKIGPIQNQASRTARKAPMDFDIGINTEGNREQSRKLLKQLGGAKGVDKFHVDLEIALKEAYSEVAQQLGARTVRPDKAILTGATHFHPEAYADADVLKEGGVPGKDLIQQTADVSKYKVDYFKNRVPKVFSLEAAWKESARGTLKDLEKMERVFLDLEKNIGVKPQLSEINLKVKGLLEKVSRETDTAAMHALNEEIKILAGTDIYGACKILIDNMEAAIRLKPTGILALDLLLRKLFKEADPAKRLELVQSQLKYIKNNPQKVAESQRKALEELERVITAYQGDTFLMKILKNPTGQMLVVSALVNAPFALYSMYQAYQQGEMNDLSDAAAVLIEFVPGGMSVKKSLTQGMNAGTVLSFAKEALYFTPAWPLVLAGDVLSMSIEIGKTMNVSNYQSGLVDLLVYNGKFEKGQLSHLELLDEKRVERADLEPFFFNTTYVAVKTSIPGGWGLRINNLSEKAMEVYNEHYLKADSVLEQLRNAAESQLSAINKAEAGKYLDIYNGNFIPNVAAAKYLIWLAGFDLLCNKSPEKWCKVFNLLKEKIEKRKEYVQKNVMIPDLIRMAEAKYTTLNAEEDLSKKMEGLQKELEGLRGSPLGINLIDEINKRAKEKADATDSRIFGATDTKETKKMNRGGYWQKAFDGYSKILSLTKDLKSKIKEQTGYDRPSLLQFVWSGDFDQDLLRAAQSRTGTILDIARIKKDIAAAKGSTPELTDQVDKQAFDLLNDVVFRWRDSFDQNLQSGPTGLANIEEIIRTANAFDPKHREGSSFYPEHKEALEKVKDLYVKKDAFQNQLEKGAQIVKDQDFLVLEKTGSFELKFNDETLKKELDQGTFTLKWTSSSKEDFKPDDKSLKVNFTPFRPEPVTISVQVEKRVTGKGAEKVTGTLKVVMPVKVPDDFLKLELKPPSPKAEEKATADTTIPGRFYGKGNRFHYKWSGTNCQVEDVDRLSTTVTAPKSGKATITVELLVEDADEKQVSLITKQVTFDVDKKPDGTSDDKPKGDQGDKPGAPPVIAQPGAYTQGQIGVDGGVSGQAGVTPGPTGQTGTPGQPETGTQDQPVTGVKGEAGVTGQDTTGQKDGGIKGEAGITSGQSGQVGISSKTPTCTYKYSEWGECDRATKTQKRTVIGKGPQGCVESGKPELERGGCTPPPTEEEKRNSYLSCLCRCYSGWAGHIGVFYAPTGYQDCGGSGPCVGGIGAFGNCSRHFYGAPNDCAKGCYEGTYGKGSYDEKKADQIRKDVNIKFKKPLSIKIGNKCPIKAQLGEIINLTASVEGGIPPYKYSWSGNGQAKENTFTFANTRGPGSHPISVTVSDDDGGSASVSCTITVDALVVKIDLLDAENKILIGGSRNFRGTVMSGDQPAKGDFYFLWQPHPEISFSPFEKTGGNISGTKATFRKLGKFKIWVIAQTVQGNVKTTIGESEQIEIEVSKPELELTVKPENPKVGQEVKLTVKDKPKMDDKTVSFWWEISGNTLNAGPLKNEREYTFRPKDSKPVIVTVHGKARDGGDDLGEAKATITAQAYEVKLGEPQHLPPKPRIWKCDTQLGRAKDCGIVELNKELAVFNDIFIKAGVTPEPEKPPLWYDWSIDPTGVCGLPGAGQQLKINCSQPGSFTVTVKVRDSQNVELGTASTQVGITVTKDDLDKGKKHLVTLQTDKTALKIGETANIKATVKGGKPPYTYKWGEGLEGKGESAKFSPKKSGPQKISVEVTDSTGQKSPATLDIKVEAAKLEVALSPDKPSIKLGETVLIKAVVKGGESKITYKWGEGVEGKEDVARFNPKKSGAQKISLEVADGKGQKATATLDIKVEAPKLEVALSADKTSLKVGETVVIKAGLRGGEPAYSYKWSEGVDGKNDLARFIPKKSGAQKVSLEVTDSKGTKVLAAVDIKVEAPKLEASLKADKTTLKIGETVTIKAEVKGGEPAYTYKWMDGLAGQGESASYTPKKAGPQKITLVVTDSAKQKSSASLDLTVEASKLEVTLTVDKSPLKTGETAKIQAAIKGGKEPYTYSWSGQVEGKEKTATFSPKTPGFFKIYLEVRDGERKKAVGNLDLTVQEGKGDGKTSDTKGIEPKTSGPKIGETKPSDGKTTTGTTVGVTKTSGPKDSDPKDGAPAAKQVIEPELLKLAPGASGFLKAFEIDQDGKKTEVSSSKVSWKIELYRGATIDRTGNVVIDKKAKPATAIKVTALFEKSQISSTVQIIEAPETTTSQTKEPGSKEGSPAILILQPDPLRLTPGESGLISLLEKDGQGRTVPLKEPGGFSWKLETNLKDFILKPQKDGTAIITAQKTAKVGTKTRILAGKGKAPLTGIIEIIPSSDQLIKGKEIEKEKPPEPSTGVGKPSIITKGQEKTGYNPLSDPGLTTAKSALDVSKVDKFKESFQTNQWETLTKKTTAATQGSQQNVQQQPTDYTKLPDSSTTKPPDQPGSSPQPSPTGDPTKPSGPDSGSTGKPGTTSTAQATKTGIDVQVVGTAPAGKCIIVEGQLLSVKGYKENIANMTVTLTGPVTKSVTSSAKGAFTFPEIPAGNYIVSVKQWDYGMTKQNFTAPSGKSVKIVLKGSCPFLYVWTGKGYEKENDIFPVARLTPQELLSDESRLLAQQEGLFLNLVSLETIPEKLKREKSQRDYYQITRPLIPDSQGNYRLRIREQASEHSFTDQVRLMVVDHKKKRKIGITREGQPFLYQGLHPLNAIKNPVSLYNGDTIELKVPSEAFQDGVLSVSWQGFQEGSPEGHTQVKGQPRLSLQRKNPRGIWETTDWVFPRDEIQESFFIMKNLGPGWDREGNIRLVAASCQADTYHRIDKLAWGKRSAGLPRLSFLTLQGAVKSTGEAVLRDLEARDGLYLTLGPEEMVDLVFKGTPVFRGRERSFIFISEGFYIPLPLVKLTAN